MGACECLRREISWWPLVFFKFLVFFLTKLHSLWDPSSSSKDPTRALRMKVLSPNHWTAREFPTIHVTILFLVFTHLSGCFGSWLQHTGSLLHHVGSLLAANMVHLHLWFVGSVGVVSRLNCAKAFETLVPQLGLEYATLALQGRFFFFLNNFYLFICHLFLAELCLHCCMGFSPVAASGDYSLAAVYGLLIAVASRCRTGALGHSDFSSCGSGLLWCTAAAAPRHVGSSWVRAPGTRVPCSGRRSRHQGVAREAGKAES